MKYSHNKKAWMVATVFGDWLHDFDRQIAQANRRVLLLVACASNHMFKDNLSHITVKYLPSSMAACVESKDSLMIQAFKAHYRLRLVQHYLQCVEEGQPQQTSLQQAVCMVSSAWDAVTSKTIVNSWQADISSPGSSANSLEDDGVPYAELASLILKLVPSMREPVSPLDYVSVDSSEPTGELLSDADILDIASNAERSSCSDDDCEIDHDAEDDDDDYCPSSGDSCEGSPEPSFEQFSACESDESLSNPFQSSISVASSHLQSFVLEGRRKRVSIPASVKCKVCQLAADHPEWKLTKLGAEILRTEGIDIGRTTLSDILKAKEEWLSVKEGDNTCRKRSPKVKRVEEALFLWLADMTARSTCVNDQMMMMKVAELRRQLKVDDCTFSKGWLQRFKYRRGITNQLLKVESCHQGLSTVSAERSYLQQVMADYKLSDIFTMEETGLLYQIGPKKLQASPRVNILVYEKLLSKCVSSIFSNPWLFMLHVHLYYYYYY